jgi:diguanylate cyclase (GGDEF)-like protein
MSYAAPYEEASAAAWRSWERKADAVIAEIGRRLLSYDEMDHYIGELVSAPNSPFAAITVVVHAGDPFDEVTFGESGDGDPDSTTVTFGNSDAYGRISLWPATTPGPMDRTRVNSKVINFVRAFWRSDGRDRVSTILNSQRGEVQQSLENAIAGWAQAGQVALIFGDIDHFKAWNDQRHQIEGDRLIRKLAAALLRRSPASALVVRRGGDEFLVAAPVDEPAKIIVDVVRLRREAEQDLTANEEPLDGQLQIGLSLGIAFISSPDALNYDALETRADNALKPLGIKQRGRVSIEQPTRKQEALSADTDLCVITALSEVGTTNPFANLWLSYVSTCAEWALNEATGDNAVDLVAERISTVLNDVDPNWDAREREANQIVGINPITGQRSMSAVDVAAALSHGIVRSGINSAEWQVSWALDGSAAAVTHIPSRTAVFRYGEQPLTEIIGLPSLNGDIALIDGHKAILVRIGMTTPELPNSLFAESVYVDDRPTTGGGLPDLWEAALAQIVASLNRLPNISLVLITGDESSGARTVDWLNRADEWGNEDIIDELAYKLGTSTHLIRDAGRRIASHVKVAGNVRGAVESILLELRDSPTLAETHSVASQRQDPPLRRLLSMEGMVLEREDGCRVATAYEAFPVALDIIRQHRGQSFHDQVGREYTELTDFKILLSNPTVDTVPRYHLNATESLSNYFQQEFCDPKGKFRAALDASEQLPKVLEHVAEAIQVDFATRRGILVVPHVPSGKADLAPLGLVSIRINPVPREDGFVLAFSYTWRTVEALVGLPYSLYGSIHFGEYLTEQIRHLIGNPARSLRMTQLSYIAHSLHMHVDEYAQNVARLIVNDATQ